MTGVSWWKASPPTTLKGRWGAAAANDPASGVTVLFGGLNGTLSSPTFLGDTWVLWYANQTWRHVADPAWGSVSPSARSDAAMVWDPGAGPSGAFVLVDGAKPFASFANDTWWFYPSNLTWRQPYSAGALPPARAGMAAAPDPAGTGLAIFGGEGYAGTPLNDTWSYSATTLLWTRLSTSRAPPPLFYPAGAGSASDLVVFGGLTTSGATYGGTWSLPWPTGPTATWTNDSALSVMAPAPREQAGLLALPSTGGFLLYGGEGTGGTNVLQDLWSLNSSGFLWTLLSSSSAPGALTRASFVPTGPLPEGLLMWGGLASLTSSGSAAAWIGGALPAPAPTLVSGGVVSRLVVGSTWSAWGDAAAGSGFGLASVSITYQLPGGGLPVTADLPYTGGTTVGSTVLAGNFSGTLPTFADPGAVPWTLSATSTGGSQANLTGTSYVHPASATLTGTIYAALIGGPSGSTPLPVGGVNVTARGVGTGNLTTTTSAANGTYSLVLAAGTYNISATPPISRSDLQSYSNRSYGMGWRPANLVIFLPDVTGASPDVNGTVKICGYPDRLPQASVWVSSADGAYNATTTTDSSGAFALTLVRGAQGTPYFLNVTDPLFVRNSTTFFLNATGPGVVLHICLAPVRGDIVMTVTMAADPDPAHPGVGVMLNFTITNKSSFGPTTPVSLGFLNLTFLYPPSNTLLLTQGAGGIRFLDGLSSITFTVPSSIPNHTNCTVEVSIDSPGLPSVSVPLRLEVVQVFPGPSTSSPTTPLWMSALPYVAIAVILAAVGLFILRSRNRSRVEEVFLVYRGGKLVWHASRTARADLEPEVVTGMLQAVEGIVERSFSPEGGHLNVLDFASMKLHIVRGHRLVAAVVLSGRNPKEVAREVGVALEDMEHAWHESLIDWDGTAASLPHLRTFMDALLAGYYRRHTHLKTSDVDASKLAD